MVVETYETSRSILCGLDLDVHDGFGAKYQAQLKLKIWVWGRELEEKERGFLVVFCVVYLGCVMVDHPRLLACNCREENIPKYGLQIREWEGEKEECSWVSRWENDEVNEREGDRRLKEEGERERERLHWEGGDLPRLSLHMIEVISLDGFDGSLYSPCVLVYLP